MWIVMLSRNFFPVYALNGMDYFYFYILNMSFETGADQHVNSVTQVRILRLAVVAI